MQVAVGRPRLVAILDHCSSVPHAARLTRPHHTGRKSRGAACPALSAVSAVSVPLSAAPAALASNLPAYFPAVMGGMSIGLLALAQLVICGRVLGISGAVRGLVEAPFNGGEQSKQPSWRSVFVGGLFVGGLLLQALLPASDLRPAIFPAARIATAGLLVGVGTSLSNGCTSGHGICGNARLSIRSFVSTCTFMMFGALAVTVLHSSQGLPSGFIIPQPASPQIAQLSSMILGSTVVFFSVMSFLVNRARALGESGILGISEQLTNFGTGILFALSLGVSGMVDSSKVVGFLSVFSGSWDATLGFVMAGALLVALPGYQFVLSRFGPKAPLACSAFSLPQSKEINKKLLLGSAIFGTGWGMAGLCPGPALATHNLVFVATMVVGMSLTRMIQSMMSTRSSA
jgi:uncharacterized membrane protein YedE/YeeE